MPVLLRFELGLVVFLILFLLIKTINKNILKLNYALIWLFFCIAMIVAIIFPTFVDKITIFLDIKYTSNFLFLVGFIMLFLITFNLTLIVSRQSVQIKTLIQNRAIDNFDDKRKN